MFLFVKIVYLIYFKYSYIYDTVATFSTLHAYTVFYHTLKKACTLFTRVYVIYKSLLIQNFSPHCSHTSTRLFIFTHTVVFIYIYFFCLNDYVYIKMLLCLQYMYLFIQVNMCIFKFLKLHKSNVHCYAIVFRDINEDEWL